MNEAANRCRALVSAFLRAVVCCLVVVIIAGLGCNSTEKEKEPIVFGTDHASETFTARRNSFRRSRHFCLGQQAVVIPKITSTIKTFLVQRGSRVHKGQLLAVLENADLSAAARRK